MVIGCGSAHGPTGPRSSTPAYLTEPETRQQQLIAEGARLVVADGCASCHLSASTPVPAPSFTSFAGHHVALADGRRVRVNERFLREGLLHPTVYEIKGYAAAPMLAALERVHLANEPAQLAALAAFIEEVGPEPE